MSTAREGHSWEFLRRGFLGGDGELPKRPLPNLQTADPRPREGTSCTKAPRLVSSQKVRPIFSIPPSRTPDITQDREVSLIIGTAIFKIWTHDCKASRLCPLPQSSLLGPAASVSRLLYPAS